MDAATRKFLKTRARREQVGETGRDKAIRIVAELLAVHEAARKNAGYDQPLTAQDQARLKMIVMIAKGPNGDAVLPLIQQVFPGWTPTVRTPEPAPAVPEGTT